MWEFSTIGWLVVVLCAGMIGFSKTGVPGAGILVPLLMMMVMAEREKESTGLVLPMLCIADIMAIIYWRRHVDWGKLVRLLPWTVGGVVLGYLIMGWISNDHFVPAIGVVVLGLIAVSWWRDRGGQTRTIPTYWWFAGLMGLLAGSTSMMANAAGPVMILYLLAMKLEKKEFVGTAAWFFWILNLIKIPFSGKLGFITQASLLTDAAMIPALLAGGILGIYLVHRIPQKPFNRLMKVLAALAALVFCIRAFL